MQRVFWGLIPVWLCLAACGGDADEKSTCITQCVRTSACPGSPVVNCDSSCAQTVNAYRSSYLASQYNCSAIESNVCTSGSVYQSCISAAMSAALSSPSGSDKSYMQTCYQKRSLCDNKFSDTYCANAPIWSDSLVSQQNDCFMLPCDQMTNCLSNVQQSFGVGETSATTVHGGGDGGTTTTTGGSSSASCDITNSGTHLCSDYTSSVSAAVDSFKSSCGQSSGTVGTACTHTGSNGGCRTSTSASGTTTTVWYYGSQTATQVMQACTSANATYVSP